MNKGLKVVKVYGALRKRLGQCRFEFDVTTPAQAIKALCVNFPGLDKWLIDSEQDGIGYRVSVGREEISNDPEAFGLPFSDKEVFSLTPVVAGAGRGTGQILAGVALVALTLVPGGLPISGALATKIGLLGGSLILSGIATAISPQPDLDSTLDESVQLESFTFSNVVNTQRQGMPVPIAYGRLFVGSAVLSSGLDVDQVQV